MIGAIVLLTILLLIIIWAHIDVALTVFEISLFWILTVIFVLLLILFSHKYGKEDGIRYEKERNNQILIERGLMEFRIDSRTGESDLFWIDK